MRQPPQRRYSEAFKMQVVGELESGKLTNFTQARRTYGIKGRQTLARWLKQYGKQHLLPGVLRVETANEHDRLKALEQENRRLKQALADAHLDAVLNDAWFKIAAERAGITDLEAFKKKHESRLLP